MTLFLTNTPVTWYERHGSSPARVQDTIRKLKELYFKRELVTVTTTRGVNRNMAITSIELSNKVETGTSREIPITFQEVWVTKTQTTSIPDSYGRGGATGVNAGTANTTVRKVEGDPPEASDRPTFAYQFFDHFDMFGSKPSAPRASKTDLLGW